MKMMRWNRILPILLGVMLISKGFVSAQYSDEDDDDDYSGGGGARAYDTQTTEDYSGDGLEATTVDEYSYDDDDVPTTEEPVVDGDDSNGDGSGSEQTTEEPEDYTEETTDDYDYTDDPEESTGMTPEDPEEFTEAPEDVWSTETPNNKPEITEPLPVYNTEDTLNMDSTPSKPSFDPLDLGTTAPDSSYDPNAATDSPTTEDAIEESTPEAIPTPFNPFQIPFKVETTTEDDGIDDSGADGRGAGNTDQYGSIISTTEASDDQPTTEGDVKILQRGGPRQIDPIRPEILDTLPELTKANYSINHLPNGTALEELGDNFEIVGAGGVAGGDFSKIIANKHGFYVLHPVQTKTSDIVFDPYTIGQVLGYLYEFNEFGGHRPKDGWTAELMGYNIPKMIKKKRSAGVRRATLVFKKKPKVVAEEEKEYWKQYIASI